MTQYLAGFNLDDINQYFAGFNIDGTINPIFGLAIQTIIVGFLTLLFILVYICVIQQQDSSSGLSSPFKVRSGGSSTGALSRNSSSDSLCDVSMGLKKEEQLTARSNATPTSNDRVLSASSFQKFNVLSVTKVSYNTKLIRFEIPYGRPLGLSIGRHISVRAEIEGSKVIRAYTPCSRPDQCGYFDLLVKSYEYGKLSPYLHSLRPGHAVDIRGPVGRFQYRPNQHTHIGLIAGGTGLTPCLQVVRCVLEVQATGSPGPGLSMPVKEGEEKDHTRFTLFFQNRSEEDVLLREQLDSLAKRFPTKFRVLYFLSNPSSVEYGKNDDSEYRGYITSNTSLLQELLHPDVCPYVCICGPSGFNDNVKKALTQMGHIEEGDPEGRNSTIYT
eukprot:CAMPEP_0175005956 /NCGR_PEP_ID=MMETSP0005-20121125/5594_1 /TAXON_ID=420556 /ORGANISM="Ochromonas sp., Strain CCMP1393" /LENGTH=385 /DNA_ID=CAMNT_0016261245 /DNA_START=24 /DNA_END=1178 /DNA_ORIENTATION=-